MYNFESVCGAKSEQVVAANTWSPRYAPARLVVTDRAQSGGGGSAAARTPAGSGHRQDGVIHIPRSWAEVV
jgi:hypothetical protein